MGTETTEKAATFTRETVTVGVYDYCGLPIDSPVRINVLIAGSSEMVFSHPERPDHYIVVERANVSSVAAFTPVVTADAKGPTETTDKATAAPMTRETVVPGTYFMTRPFDQSGFIVEVVAGVAGLGVEMSWGATVPVSRVGHDAIFVPIGPAAPCEPTERQVEAAAAAILNARMSRRGCPTHVHAAALADARAALKAAAEVTELTPEGMSRPAETE